MHAQAEIEEHWRAMVRVARSVLGSRDEAEECAGAAMVQVLERQPAGVRSLEAYMVTVAKRRALDRLRILHRSRRRDLLLAAQSGVGIADIAEDVVARDEARWMDEQARQRLSAQSFRILQAVANNEELEHVARREGITLRAAQSDLFRSRRLLRSVWARTLAFLGGAWALGRLRPVTAVAPLTAVGLVLVLLPSAGGSLIAPSEAVPIRVPLFAHGNSAFVTTAVPGRTTRVSSASKAAKATPTVVALETTSRSTHPVTVVRSPAGTTVIQKEQHGSGPSGDPVTGAVECIAHVSLDPHNLGC
jgi:DNA-directed RNA polymerase specialized sigma24 family protein